MTDHDVTKLYFFPFSCREFVMITVLLQEYCKRVLALASVINYNRKCDTTIWSATYWQL